MAATRLLAGKYREIWVEADPHLGGQQRTITTGIRVSANVLARIRPEIFLGVVVGTVNLVAALIIINGFLAIIVTNTGLNNTSATYTLDVTRAHSLTQSGFGNIVVPVYVVGNSGGGAPAVPAMTATPSTLVQTNSENNTIVLAGSGTAWVEGVTVFTVDGGTATQIVHTPTSATLLFDAPAAPATITVSDGSINATFAVVAASMSVNPANVVGGSINNTLTLTGINTIWQSGTLFTVTAGTITARTVNNPTSATLTYTAPAGDAIITLATVSGSGQSTTFTVTAAALQSMTATPTRAVGTNTTLNTINVVGTNTTWNGSTVFSVSGGSATAVVNSPTTATLTYAAPAGAGAITVTTGVLSANFNVVVSSMVASPLTIDVNTSGNVITLTGTNTNWINGTTTFSAPGVTITAQSVTNATTASITVTAPLNPVTITVSGGGQSTTFGVVAVAGPSMAVTPGFAIEPSTPGNRLALSGSGTAWTNATPFTVSGGAVVTGVQVASGTEALLTVTAPAGTGALTVSDGTLSTQVSRVAAITKTIDFSNKRLAFFGASDMQNDAGSDPSNLIESVRTLVGCPANRCFDHAFGATGIINPQPPSTISLESCISTAIAQGHFGSDCTAILSTGNLANECLLWPGSDASRLADPVIVANNLALFLIQLNRIRANYGTLVVLEQCSHSPQYASDGAAYLRAQLELFWTAQGLNKITNYVPVFSVTGTNGIYYVTEDQGPPPGPHLSSAIGIPLVASLVADRLWRATSNLITMTATPTDVVRRGSTGNTITLTGSGTAWTGGTSFTVSSGGGSITAQSVTGPETATITYNAPAGAATVVISDGTHLAPFNVVVPSISVDPVIITAGTTNNSIIVTGVNSGWTAPNTPTFTISAGATITAQVVNSPTQATLTVTAGSTAGTITITDPLRNTTATIEIEAAAPSAIFDHNVFGPPAQADGAVGNGWTVQGGAVHTVVSGLFTRTDDSGHLSLQLAGGAFPADAYYSIFVPHSMLSSRAFWGFCARHSGTYFQNNQGVGVFVEGFNGGIDSIRPYFGMYDNWGTWDTPGLVPRTQCNNLVQNRMHMITLGMVGTTITLYFDGQIFDTFTSSIGNVAGRYFVLASDRFDQPGGYGLQVARTLVTAALPAYP